MLGSLRRGGCGITFTGSGSGMALALAVGVALALAVAVALALAVAVALALAVAVALALASGAGLALVVAARGALFGSGSGWSSPHADATIAVVAKATISRRDKPAGAGLVTPGGEAAASQNGQRRSSWRMMR